MGTVAAVQLVKSGRAHNSVWVRRSAGAGGGCWARTWANFFCRLVSRRWRTAGRDGGTGGTVGVGSGRRCQVPCGAKAQASVQMSLFFFIGITTSIPQSRLQPLMRSPSIKPRSKMRHLRTPGPTLATKEATNWSKNGPIRLASGEGRDGGAHPR